MLMSAKAAFLLARTLDRAVGFKRGLTQARSFQHANFSATLSCPKASLEPQGEVAAAPRPAAAGSAGGEQSGPCSSGLHSRVEHPPQIPLHTFLQPKASLPGVPGSTRPSLRHGNPKVTGNKQAKGKSGAKIIIVLESVVSTSGNLVGFWKQQVPSKQGCSVFCPSIIMDTGDRCWWLKNSHLQLDIYSVILLVLVAENQISGK
ncbi:hypothetical protein Anapl_06794 [Anas platyrhynchos]|uniref:Uncharacterized protein n=1 Tax=Anas platyrhynchos TaxID=8839 RepID=R0LZC5_ANAPL|nr:hypothetical protein Anapl_06794 [Anas platyrhynchos]